MSRKILRLALGMTLAFTAAAAAHDLWIEPSSFTPAPATRLAVRLRIGQLFQGDPFPRDAKLMVRFSVLGPAGEAPIPGVPDTDPAGFLIAGPPGLYELVYTSNHASVTLDAAKFEKYLADEGLDEISALRKRRGLTAAGVREIFSRCAKSLVEVGGDPGTGYDRVLGLKAGADSREEPYAMEGGQELAGAAALWRRASCQCPGVGDIQGSACEGRWRCGQTRRAALAFASIDRVYGW